MLNPTRREALRGVALFGTGMLLAPALSACGLAPNETLLDDGTPATTEGELVICKPPVISANHGHSLVVSPADVAAKQAKTYSIKGSAGHDHNVAITAAQFATLGLGQTITVTSTNDAGHTHTVTVTCATVAPPATCKSGAAGAIAANHGHSLSVSAADITAGGTKTYSIQGKRGSPPLGHGDSGPVRDAEDGRELHRAVDHRRRPRAQRHGEVRLRF